MHPVVAMRVDGCHVGHSNLTVIRKFVTAHGQFTFKSFRQNVKKSDRWMLYAQVIKRHEQNKDLFYAVVKGLY